MTWILFVWTITGAPTLMSQEFNTHKACVDSAIGLQQNLGRNMGFMCVEKGKVKK